MKRVITLLCALVFLVLWVTSGLRSQASVKSDETTVQAQLTAVMKPTPVATR